MKKIISIKFGGSIMVPSVPDSSFLKEFVGFIKKQSEKYRFILVVGGGGINSQYNAIAKEIRSEISNEELDWIGIFATRFNARLLISVLGSELCHEKIITDPTSSFNWQKDVIIGAGWKPGWSTDYDSMILAHRFQADKVIVATNTDQIYDKDPNQNKDASPLKYLSWKELRKMVGENWIPKMHIPLDPSAVRFAEEKKMTIISLNGKNLKNMEKAINGEEFIGTVVE